MPRYFFDIYNTGPHKDDTGLECASLEDVRAMAMSLLPDVAREEIAQDGDRTTFTVVVRDESRQPVFTATLMVSAQMLVEDDDA